MPKYNKIKINNFFTLFFKCQVQKISKETDLKYSLNIMNVTEGRLRW